MSVYLWLKTHKYWVISVIRIIAKATIQQQKKKHGRKIAHFQCTKEKWCEKKT